VLGKDQLPIIGTDGCLYNACLLFNSQDFVRVWFCNSYAKCQNCFRRYTLQPPQMSAKIIRAIYIG